MNGMFSRIALSLGMLASAIGSAQALNTDRPGEGIEPAQEQSNVRNTGASAQAQNMRPDSLLAVDRNRSAVIERIITQFREGFAPGQEKVVRETLQSLRADHLLAASLAPSLDGLVAAMKAADTGIGAAPISAKFLGDPTADLVYTPRVPCRLFDSRGSQGGLGPLTPGVTRTYSVTAPVIQQGGPGGCTAPAGTAVAFIQIAALSPVGAGLIQGGASGSGPFLNALVLYQPGGLDGAGVPMPVNVANGQFDLVAQFSGVEVAGDLLGYFIEPQATSFDCVNTGFPTHAISANSSTYFSNPACPAGYQATLPYCYTAALGVYSQGSGHINDGQGALTFCAWQNTTGASQTVYGGGVCCRVPGR